MKTVLPIFYRKLQNLASPVFNVFTFGRLIQGVFCNRVNIFAAFIRNKPPLIPVSLSS